MKFEINKSFSPRERFILTNLVKEFSKITYVERIFVFGSRARGDSNENSDFDVVVIINASLKEIRKTIKLLQDAKNLALNDPEDLIYVNLIPISKQIFEKETELVKNIKKEGIEIWKK